MKRIGSRGRAMGGFTLVEIIIVLAVLGVLAVMVVPTGVGYLRRGEERAWETDQRLIQATVDAWRTDVARRAGNPWPTVGGVKGTPADSSSPLNGTYVDAGDVNSFIKLTDLIDSDYLKGSNALPSYKYAPATTLGDTGVPSTSKGSYLWYVDGGGVLQAYYWADANDDGKVAPSEISSGYQPGVYP